MDIPGSSRLAIHRCYASFLCRLRCGVAANIKCIREAFLRTEFGYLSNDVGTREMRSSVRLVSKQRNGIYPPYSLHVSAADMRCADAPQADSSPPYERDRREKRPLTVLWILLGFGLGSVLMGVFRNVSLMFPMQ